jgi:hypothetical protein
MFWHSCPPSHTGIHTKLKHLWTRFGNTLDSFNYPLQLVFVCLCPSVRPSECLTSHLVVTVRAEPYAIPGALSLLAWHLLVISRPAWCSSSDMRGLADAGGAPRIVIGTKSCSTTYTASSTCSFVQDLYGLRREVVLTHTSRDIYEPRKPWQFGHGCVSRATPGRDS